LFYSFTAFTAHLLQQQPHCQNIHWCNRTKCIKSMSLASAAGRWFNDWLRLGASSTGGGGGRRRFRGLKSRDVRNINNVLVLLLLLNYSVTATLGILPSTIIYTNPIRSVQCHLLQH